MKSKKQIVLTIIVPFLIGAILSASTAGIITLCNRNNGIYGTRDGKHLTGKPPYEYLSDSSFTPIDCKMPKELQEYTYYLCEAYYLDFDFVMALIYTESSFNANAVSEKGSYGLMQISKVNHDNITAALGITDFTEPYGNIRAGLYILRGLFEKYDDERRVLMAYNMGEYGATVLWEQDIHETSYTNKVLAKADEYAEQRASASQEKEAK